jgi:hypothetical protein
MAGASAEEPAEAGPLPAVETPPAAEEPQAAEASRTADGAALDAEAPTERKRRFWFIGTSNYHLRLEESEDQIDRELNALFGAVLPKWDNPTTFKDWSDEFRIWDLWGGYGQDINESLSWTIYGGGGLGTIRNSKTYYPLLVPTDIDADFTRKSIFVGTSLRWWPVGRPEKRAKGLAASLKAARPVAEINLGYTRQWSIADVKVKLPLLGEALRIEQEDRYHLLWASPRAGLEIPINRDDSINVLGGYQFFHEHGAEFDGVILEAFFSRRF